MHSRRALLYTPGDDLHKIHRAITLGVDCLCLDMEDGVADNRKAAARRSIVEALGALDFGPAERLARINALGSRLEEEDLQAILPTRPDGIVVPKVESADQVRWVSARISEVENRHGWPSGGIALLVQIETAMGVINAAQIAGADPRLQALIFGAEDLACDVGAYRTEEGWEIYYARSAVVTSAAAYRLDAIDMVCADFRNLDRLRRESVQGHQMGFAGKQIIHPNQVHPVQQAYTPTPEAIAHAQRIIDAFHQHQSDGFGAFALDGKMVDAPMVKAAQRVLERALAARRSGRSQEGICGG